MEGTWGACNENHTRVGENAKMCCGSGKVHRWRLTPETCNPPANFQTGFLRKPAGQLANSNYVIMECFATSCMNGLPSIQIIIIKAQLGRLLTVRTLWTG
uniref:Uncharacterized protein n=1 Tax=Micrurus surinamensis TaxID=129470 RepID=A0A2D4NP77_MICSU